MGALILLYHRVTAPAHDPWGLSVHPKRFQEHLSVLVRHYRVISLTELVKQLKAGKVPDRAVVITFDDGYADNLHEGKPLLDLFEVPATVFVTSGAVGMQDDFWWDKLATLLLEPDRLPEVLTLDSSGEHIRWRVESIRRTRRSRFRRIARRLYPPHFALSREELYYATYAFMRPLNASSRERVLESLATWSQAPVNWRCKNPILSDVDLRTLANSGLIEIGAHTVTHERLSLLTATEQMHEMLQSREQLIQALGIPITSFAYPFGTRTDFDDVSIAKAAEAGFESACSAEKGVVTPCSSLYSLPRLAVPDWDGAKLARAVEHLIG